VSVHADRFSPHLKRIIGERHPDSSPGALRGTADYLRQQFTGCGLTTVSHEFSAWGGIYENVIATTPFDTADTAPSAAPLIVAAHYDTVIGSPGADDNASALAVLLDVARQVARRRFQRPVRFIAFCLEEENLLGSRAYAAHLDSMQQSILGAIVLECVGYARDEEGSQKIPPGVPVTVPTVGNFLAVIGNQDSQALTMAIEQAMNPHVPVVPLVVPGNGERLPDTRRSDHTSFWERGFPAVMLTDTANFRNPHYHKPTDRLETLNLDFMASVADAVAAAVLALAGPAEVS
jgi:Zn-dependent M28 family amino/carboxypeptidase